MQSDQGGVVGELPLLSVLFAEHRTSIDAIKQRPECAPLLQPEHDDLFILRYVLSFKGDLQKCATAIKNAIEWRRANQNILARIDELQEEVRKIIPTGMLPWQTNQGQPIQVAIPFAVEASTWSTKSEQWHHEAGISNREVAYRICDKLSRESGRLVKLVMIQDLTGLSMAFVMQNSRLAQNQGKLSKLAEFLFPQLIATVVVTHPPSFIQTVYKMAGAVLSERLVKKVKMAENPEKICLVRAPAHSGGRGVKERGIQRWTEGLQDLLDIGLAGHWARAAIVPRCARRALHPHLAHPFPSAAPSPTAAVLGLVDRQGAQLPRWHLRLGCRMGPRQGAAAQEQPDHEAALTARTAQSDGGDRVPAAVQNLQPVWYLQMTSRGAPTSGRGVFASRARQQGASFRAKLQQRE